VRTRSSGHHGSGSGSIFGRNTTTAAAMYGVLCTSSLPWKCAAPATAAAPKPHICCFRPALHCCVLPHPPPVFLQSAVLRHPHQRHRQAMTPSRATMVWPKHLVRCSPLSASRQLSASKPPSTLCSGTRQLLRARLIAVSEGCRIWGKESSLLDQTGSYEGVHHCGVLVCQLLPLSLQSAWTATCRQCFTMRRLFQDVCLRRLLPWCCSFGSTGAHGCIVAVVVPVRSLLVLC
jgi:hypothetical protein